MKKILLILPCFLLCFMLVAAPVSAAADGFTVDLDMGEALYSCDQSVFGDYSVTVLTSSGFVGASFPQITVSEQTTVSLLPDMDSGGLSVYLIIRWVDGEGLKVMIFDEYDCPYVLDSLSVTFEPVAAESGTGSPLSSIVDVWSDIGSWIISNLGLMSALFWNAETAQLTLMGVLAVCSLGIAVVFALILIVRKFLGFRG